MRGDPAPDPGWRGSIAHDVEELIERHGGRVMRILLDVLRHQQDAEDAWQETWASVWKARRRLAPDRDAWPFIRATAIRKALDRRRGARFQGLDAEPQAPAKTDAEPPDLMARLPLGERTVLVLYFWEGLSVREIGEALDTPEATVKTWMFRGRERLRKLMRDERGARDELR